MVGVVVFVGNFVIAELPFAFAELIFDVMLVEHRTLVAATFH